MTPDADWSLIDRYLAGEATAEERRRLEAWLDADPSRAAWLDGLRARVAGADDERWDVDGAWARLAARTIAGIPSASTRVLPMERPAPPARPGARRGAWLTRVAAAAVLVAGAAAVWRMAERREHAPTAAVATRELLAPRGGRASALLRDGTRVILNAGSRLRYAADFGDGARDVWLDGEGYFEVRHDAAHPFRVHAGGGLAEDLGTKFVVRAYPELSRVDVLVTEGRVSLRRDSGAASADSAVVGAGQLGRLARGAAPTVTFAARDEPYLAWTTGTLVLDDVPLADALPMIERRYDLAIVLADTSLGARHVVGRFHDRPAGEVLDALALALGARYERSGRTVTFHAREGR